MKYIGYYDIPANSRESRNIALAATNKMKYIADALNKEGIAIEFISASGTRGRHSFRGKIINDGDLQTIRLFYTLGKNSKFRNGISFYLTKFLFFVWLLLHVKKNEIILVYHAIDYMNEIEIIHKLKKCKLILEMEEIFGDVKGDDKLSHRELCYSQKADGYIFPTKMLNSLVNTEHKPYVIINGTYQSERIRKDVNCFDPKKVHCVYAGTFDPRKGGVEAAIKTACFLPEGYHMHIIGFGNKKEIERVKEMIKHVKKYSLCLVTFDGCYSGEDYIKYIQKCDIGLSTQNPNAKFNGTSFPSKILSYLANGLHVVSVRIPAVEDSNIGDLVSYYDIQNPKDIAKAIMEIDLKKQYDSRLRIDELDRIFRKEIIQLFNAVKVL